MTQPLLEPEIVAPTAEDPTEPTPSESQEQRDESTAESTSHSEGARDPATLPGGAEMEPTIEQPDPGLHRSSRQSTPVIGNRLIDVMSVEIHNATTSASGFEDPADHAPAQGKLFCLSAMFPFESDPMEDDPLMAYTYAMAASTDPDTMYYHQAMKAPDADQFKTCMEEEIINQWDNDNFSPMLISDVPKEKQIIPGVWALKRKRRVTTG